MLFLLFVRVKEDATGIFMCQIVHEKPDKVYQVRGHLPKRPPHLLRVFKLRLLRKVRIDAHRGGWVCVAEIALRGEDIHAGAVEDRSVVVAEVVRGQDRAGAVTFDAARGKVDVRPAKPQRFTSAQARAVEDREQESVRMRLDYLKHRGCLLRRQCSAARAHLGRSRACETAQSNRSIRKKSRKAPD